MRFTTTKQDDVKVITLDQKKDYVSIVVDGHCVAFFDNDDATLTVFPGALKTHGLTLHVSE